MIKKGGGQQLGGLGPCEHPLVSLNTSVFFSTFSLFYTTQVNVHISAFTVKHSNHLCLLSV